MFRWNQFKSSQQSKLTNSVLAPSSDALVTTSKALVSTSKIASWLRPRTWTRALKQHLARGIKNKEADENLVQDIQWKPSTILNPS